MKQILQSLESRLAWYEKALVMITGDSPWETGFGWPIIPGIPLPIGSARELYLDQYIMFLSGCIHELHNTIDMMENEAKKNKPANKNYGYQPKYDIKNPVPPTSGSNIIKR